VRASFKGVPFLVVEISLNLYKITYQPISLNLPKFASGIKKLLQGFKVLRSNANLARSEGITNKRKNNEQES
jgi:hypothetical protein